MNQATSSHRLDTRKSYSRHRFAHFSTNAEHEDERKQVTVLFADIKDSIEFVASYDAEVVRDTFLDPVLKRMIEAVHYYKGTLYSVRGDGIMALFGAPLAFEDHAVRACYASLKMQEVVAQYAAQVRRSHGAHLTIRIGLASGEIIGHASGSNPHRDINIVGQTAWLASRMEQIAKPGSVFTTADTFHLADGYVAMMPIGLVPVRGLPDPVQVYEVTGPGVARNRLQVSTRRGLTCFVGRDAELEQLNRALRLAGDGAGQVVAIVGDAGVGKSRLIHEFLLSYDKSDWLVLESSSAAYTHATPYFSVSELLRHHFKIDSHDDALSIRGNVTDGILALDPTLREIIPPLLDLLDALDDEHPFRSLDPLLRRRLTYEAVIQLLLNESRVRPVVALIEDLHWIDAITLGLLNELVIAARNARLLLVITYRPDYSDEWKDRPNYSRLRLDPLRGDSLSEFIRSLLGSSHDLSVLNSFVAERGSGNPLFVEEIVRRFVETGVLEGEPGSYRLRRSFSGSEVPPTVHAVLAARIDGLPAVEKHLLQVAAIIGRDVPFALLQLLSGLQDETLRVLLANLLTGEFLFTKQLFPDGQYTFKHALTHDVAYAGVLREHRREFHACVVEGVENLYGERLNEQVERLAYHAVQGELREKAVRYLRLSGEKAVGRSALPDARAWFEQALNVLTALPESRTTLEQAFDIRLELRSVLRQLGEVRPMLEQLRAAEAIAERLRDESRRGWVCSFLATVLSSLDELDEAVTTGGRAIEIAGRTGDQRLGAVAMSCIAAAHYHRGDYDRVVEIAGENLATQPAEWDHEYFGLAVPPSVFGRVWLTMSLTELGRFSEAYRYETEAIRIAEPTQHLFTISWAYFAASVLHLTAGNWAEALSRVNDLTTTLRSGHVAMHLPWAIASSALALARIGASVEALDRVQEAQQLLERQSAQGVVGHRSWACNTVARATLLLGRVEEAQRMAEHAFESSSHQPGFAAYALHLLGDIATNPYKFNPEIGETHYRKALQLAQFHGMRPLAAHCYYGLGRLYCQTGKTEDARSRIITATQLYQEMNMRFWLEQAAPILTNLGYPPTASQPLIQISSLTSGDR